MKKLTLLLLVMLTLSACDATQTQPASDESGYGLWFAVGDDIDRDDSSAVAFEARQWGSEPTAEELMQALLAGPRKVELYSPIPNGVSVREIQAEENGTLRVDLSEQYGGLAGFDLTLADYCITLTLCQLPGVNSVKILVEGEPISFRSRQNLQAKDLMRFDIAREPDTFLAVLCFPNQDGLGLSREYRPVMRSGDEPMEVVMTELLRGPEGIGRTNALPKETQVLGMSVNNGLCQVNLSSDFLAHMPESEAEANLTVYSLVNTLCALNTISQVRIIVEGQPVPYYGGLSLGSPLSANTGLIID